MTSRSQAEPAQAFGTPPFTRILLGVDRSEQSSRTIQTAAYLVRAFRADLIVAHVVNVSTGVAGDEFDGMPANREERAILDSLELLVHQTFGADSDKIDVKILHGDPAERLSEYADYSNCDLIIVGSRRQGAFKAAVRGSVSASTVSRSKKPVLVLK